MTTNATGAKTRRRDEAGGLTRITRDRTLARTIDRAFNIMKLYD
jgi:hypothetical protein